MEHPISTPTADVNSIRLVQPTPVRSSRGFRAATAYVARIDYSGPRSARRMSPRLQCLRRQSVVRAEQGDLAGFRLPHLLACARSGCGSASRKHRTSDSSPKSTTATHEYGLHLRSHLPNRCRYPPDTEGGHADQNSSQNTRTIISRTIHALPERRECGPATEIGPQNLFCGVSANRSVEGVGDARQICGDLATSRQFRGVDCLVGRGELGWPRKPSSLTSSSPRRTNCST